MRSSDKTATLILHKEVINVMTKGTDKSVYVVITNARFFAENHLLIRESSIRLSFSSRVVPSYINTIFYYHFSKKEE